MSKIMDGKLGAQTIKDKVAEWIKEDLRQPPILAIFTVGDDDASKVYVRNKIKAAEEVGIIAKHYTIDKEQYYQDEYVWDRTQDAIDEADGVILQKPVAWWFSENQFLEYLPFWKDVDGLTTMNVGRLRTDAREAIVPCTPAGIMELLHANGCLQKCGNALVIGRSELVGRPIAELLLQENQTVTIAHSKTPRNVLLDAFARADIVISAAGTRNLITEEDAEPYWNNNRVIVDVSINRDENGKLCGDFSEEFKQKYSEYYTPVPGGVGPMTVAMLMLNTYMAAKDRWFWESKEKKKELTE